MAHRHCCSRTLVEHDKERVVGIALWMLGLFADLIEIGEELKFAGDPDAANVLGLGRERQFHADQAWAMILPPPRRLKRPVAGAEAEAGGLERVAKTRLPE